MAPRNFGRLTIQQSPGTLELLLTILRDTGKDRLEELNRRDLKAFVEHEQDRGPKLSSVKAKLDRIHAFFGFWLRRRTLVQRF